MRGETKYSRVRSRSKHKDALITRMNEIRKQEEEKKKKKEKKRKEKGWNQEVDPLDQAPTNIRNNLSYSMESGDKILTYADALASKQGALEVRMKVRSVEPNKASWNQSSAKSGSSVLGIRRAGGQVYEATDLAPKVNLNRKIEPVHRTVARHKVHDPSHDQVHSALEKMMRQKTFDRRAAILEMTEREKEYELRKIKKKRFCEFLARVSSMLYGMFIVAAGACAYFADVYIVKRVHIIEVYNIVLCAIGTLYIVWLQMDLQNYVKFIVKYWSAQKRQVNEIHLVKNEEGMVELDLPAFSGAEENVIPEFYIFTTERHSGSYFLKIGAGFFCMGHIILLTLKYAQYFSNYDIADPEVLAACTDPIIILEISAMFIFSIAMLFVIFRYSNIIINRKCNGAKFGFMHLISASLCFWLHAIVMETFVAIANKEVGYLSKLDEEKKTSGHNPHSERGLRGGCSLCEPQESISPDPYSCDDVKEISHICFLSRIVNCTRFNSIATSVSKFAPYLYPFSMEYSILIVGIWIVIWSHIGTTEHHVASQTRFVPDHIEFSGQDTKEAHGSDAMLTLEDLATSGTGFAAGTGFLAIAIVGLISFGVLVATEGENREINIIKAIYIADTIHFTMLFVMALSCIRAYSIISNLDVNPHPVEFLDDLLLFICIPSHIVLALCSIFPYLYYILYLGIFTEAIGQICVQSMMLFQITVQTPMLVDGLTRCAEDEFTQRRKPGRNHVSFLLVSNLVIYIWDNIKVKIGYADNAAYDFYGAFTWKILTHACLPLTLFYRFHSAVALADVWSGAYHSGDHHDHHHDDYERIHVENRLDQEFPEEGVHETGHEH